MRNAQRNNLAETMADLTFELLDNCQEKQAMIAEKCSLSISEFKCLRSFRDDVSLSVKTIAGRMHLTSSRLTRIIDGLVEKRLVTRDIDSEDRRVIMVGLTEKGKAVCDKLNRDYTKIHAEILEHIPKQGRETVIEVLRNLSVAMNQWIYR